MGAILQAPISEVRNGLLIFIAYLFHRKASCLQSPESPFNRFYIGVSCLYQFLRRTGALLLVSSAAVGYDLVIAIKIAVRLGHS